MFLVMWSYWPIQCFFSKDSTDKEHQIYLFVLNRSSPSIHSLAQKLDKAAFYIYFFLMSAMPCHFVLLASVYLCVKWGKNYTLQTESGLRDDLFNWSPSRYLSLPVLENHSILEHKTTLDVIMFIPLIL